MSKTRFLRPIEPKPGCVIFLPFRNTKDVLFGIQTTKVRRRWGERWVQIQPERISLEVRLEGERAVNMGNVLKAEVVALLETQIDLPNRKEAVPRAVSSFGCTSTADSETVLGRHFFETEIQRLFEDAAYRMVGRASYDELLENPGMAKKHEDFLLQAVQGVLQERGFAIIRCELVRFAPLDPGEVLGADPKIVEKWIEWESRRIRHNTKRETETTLAQEEKKRIEAEQRLDTERRLKELARKEKDLEIEHERQVQQQEVLLAEIKWEKNETIQKMEAEAELAGLTIRRRRSELEAELKGKEIENRVNVEKLEVEAQSSKAELMLTELRSQIQLRTLELELAGRKCEIEETEGLARARVTEAQKRADATVDRALVQELFQSLPDILKSLPVERIGETNVIHVGESGGALADGVRLSGAAGYAYWPLVRRIVGLLEQRFLAPDASAPRQPDDTQ